MSIQTMVSLLGFSVLPWVALCGGYFLLLRAQARRPERFASVVGHSLVDSVLLTLAFLASATVVILTSTSSTAPIGFVFLPLYSIGVALLAFAAAWSLRTLVAAARGRAQGPATTLGAASLLIALVAASAYAWHRYTWLSEAASDQTPPPRIVAIAEKALATNDYATLERLVRNLALPVSIAEQITALCQSEVDSPTTGRCYSVFVGLAGSPAAPGQLLASLAKASDVTLRSRVAQNPLTPAAVAEALANDPEGSVRMWVPRNPKLSHATLERLAADPDPNVRSQANAAMTGSES